jgi:DNA-binding transcriptional LysR family regulator
MADIDLRHLAYFVAAAESRSFVRAAKLVNVSQPAITKSIQRMEEWFAQHPARDAAARASLPPFRPSAICSHFSTLKSIVLESDAVSALTELALRQKSYVRDFAMIDYAGITPSSNAGIVSLKKRPLSPAAVRLIEEVIAVSDQA